MTQGFGKLWLNDDGQDVAEYALMLAVIAVIVLATVQLIGSSADSVFSSIASTLSSAAVAT